VLEHRPVRGPADGEHPGAGRQVEHLQAVQAAAWGDRQLGDQQRLVAGVKRGQHVEAERRAGEPRGGQRGGRPDVLEPERLPDRVGELRVEDAQHDRGGFPARPELVADRQARLEVREVVAGQHRDRGRGGQPHRAKQLGQRRVADHHRDAERAHLAEVPVVLVHLDHHDVAARRVQLLYDPQADRAQADHQHVAAQRGDFLPAEGLLDPPADQDVGDQREEHPDEQAAGHHEQDREPDQPRRLPAEGEVAVADGRQGLDGEVQRVEQRDVVTGTRVLVGEAEHDRGGDQHRDERTERDHQPAVGGAQQRHGDVTQVADHAPARGVRPERVPGPF
jgi:hypothetical protein